MSRSRLARRLVALVSIGALVVAQALVSAYACVLPAPASAAAPCHEPENQPEPEPAPDALCKAHCEVGQQALDQPKPLATPDLVTPVLVVAVPDPADRESAASAYRSAWLAHAGAPPPLRLTGRLRI